MTHHLSGVFACLNSTQGTTPTANSIEEAAQYAILQEEHARVNRIPWSTLSHQLMALQ